MSLAEQIDRIASSGAQPSYSVSESPLPNQIAAVIRHRIIHDEIKPGAPIRERQLATELEISRTPLRDGLKILAQEGLVAHIQNRGVVAVDYSIDDITDMLQVYLELDALGGRLACRMATETDFLRIEREIERMDDATQKDDRITYFLGNQAFHQKIVAASRSKCTIEFHSNLNLRLYRVRYLSILRDDQWTDRSDDHTKLLEALRERDVERYLDLQKQHFSVAWRLLDDWAMGPSSQS